MKEAFVQLNDLPDEIILLIFKKLSNLEVLYSFIDVNKRLNNIVHDSIFTNRLTMTRCSFDGPPPPPPINPVLNRFCSQILPSISHQIKWLDVDLSSMECILLCRNYPYLYGLGLYSMEKETALRIFTGERFFFEYFLND
jgi:hypothetical protein